MDRWEALARVRLLWRWSPSEELRAALDCLVRAAGVAGCHAHTQERAPATPAEARRMLDSVVTSLVEGRPELATATALASVVWAREELDALGAHAPKVLPATAPGQCGGSP